MTMIEFARLAAKTNVFTVWVTLKALANSSPGFALKPWETQSLKGLRTSQSQPLSGLRRVFVDYDDPGLLGATLGWNSRTLSALGIDQSERREIQWQEFRKLYGSDRTAR
jgi:hypothetical protein